MSSVLNRTTGEFRRRANTPDFSAGIWIINPDLSGVQGLPRRYWKITGDVISPMTSGERSNADALAAATRKDSAVRTVNQVTMALIKALNTGTFIPGSRYSIPRIRSILRGSL